MEAIMSVYYADYHHQSGGMNTRATGDSWIANPAATRAPMDASPILTSLNDLAPSSHHQSSHHFTQSNIDSTFPFFMPQFYPHHGTDSYGPQSGKTFSSCSHGTPSASSTGPHGVVTPYSSSLFDPCKQNELGSPYLAFKATDFQKQELESTTDREIRDLASARCGKDPEGEKMAFYPWMKSISPTSGEKKKSTKIISSMSPHQCSNILTPKFDVFFHILDLFHKIYENEHNNH